MNLAYLGKGVGEAAAHGRQSPFSTNVLTMPKRLALPEKWLTMRPKRMRFQIFYSTGKLVSHARQTWLRVHRLKDQLSE
jgi:hypothetical protein